MEYKLNKKTLSAILALTLPISAHAAVPATPGIGWMQTNYSLIEVPDGFAYKEVRVLDKVTVSVPWHKWNGEAGDTINILVNGDIVFSRKITAQSSQFATENLTFEQGGQFEIRSQLCNLDGCATSTDSKQIIIADSAGNHLDPLAMKVNEARFPIKMTNKEYVNTSGKMVAGYAAEWSVYRVEGMDYYIDNLPASNLTHLFYGFIAITGPNESFASENPEGYASFKKISAGLADFELAPPDMWAAMQKPVGDQVQSDPIKGNYAQMMALKKRYPDLKIIPSIGGWTLSDPFYFMNDDNNRKTFVESSRKFLQTWPFFDGIDIDWEFPGVAAANANLGGPEDSDTYVKLMKELRQMLDEEGAKAGRTYELTSAINVGYDKLDKVDFGKASQYLDYILMMSYDYFGAWDTQQLGHQTAVYPSTFRTDDPRTQQYNLKTGIDLLKAQGVDSTKLVAGVAMYGRGWTGVDVLPGQHHMDASATGPAQPKGSFKLEPGTIMYANIAQWKDQPEWEYHYDYNAHAAYIYNPTTGDLISYDDEKSVAEKGKLVFQENLGGLFAWEFDTDNGDISNAMQVALGHPLKGQIDPPVICEDGSTAATKEECPVIVPPVVCEDGSTAATKEECPVIVPPVVCEDGSTAATEEECPVIVPPVVCEDGSTAATKEECPVIVPPVVCEDGSTAATKEECPVIEPPVVCEDGSTATTKEECPVIEPPVTEPTVIEFVLGKTKVSNGDIVSYKGTCFEAKNNPGSWEAPKATSWFWSEVNCPV